MKFFNFWNKLFPDRQELIIRTELLPDFPSLNIRSNEVIKLVREHPLIIKVSGSELIPLSQFDITYHYRLRSDSEGFPSWSPVTIKVVWSKAKLKEYKKNKAKALKC